MREWRALRVTDRKREVTPFGERYSVRMRWPDTMPPPPKPPWVNYREEFGPWTFDQMIERANANLYGVALACWSRGEDQDKAFKEAWDRIYRLDKIRRQMEG